MELQRITLPDDADMPMLIKLYVAAFPPEERRTPEELLQTIRTCKRMYFNKIKKQGETVGFSIYWQFGDFVYLEHFAILPEKRGLGIGQQVLDRLAESLGGVRVLEVEPAIDALTRRRVAFYERNGFRVVNRTYGQPPYGAPGDEFPLWIMCTADVDESTLQRYIRTIKENVYYAFYTL